MKVSQRRRSRPDEFTHELVRCDLMLPCSDVQNTRLGLELGSDQLPVSQVRGRANLWTQGPAQQQIDVRTIEELFGHNDSQWDASATPSRAGRSRGSFRDAREELSILDSKRGMNVGIFLKQFKRPEALNVCPQSHEQPESSERCHLPQTWQQQVGQRGGRQQDDNRHRVHSECYQTHTCRYEAEPHLRQVTLTNTGSFSVGQHQVLQLCGTRTT
uniref:FH2 domain-containing protein 1-like n=1 Tax=Stegastes partitus TaxID=144197 RepID=A0A3B5AZY6_9TELE